MGFPVCTRWVFFSWSGPLILYKCTFGILWAMTFFFPYIVSLKFAQCNFEVLIFIFQCEGPRWFLETIFAVMQKAILSQIHDAQCSFDRRTSPWGGSGSAKLISFDTAKIIKFFFFWHVATNPRQKKRIAKNFVISTYNFPDIIRWTTRNQDKFSNKDVDG